MNPSIRALKIFLALTLLAALCIGIGFYLVEKNELQSAAEKELTAIALLKTREITHWRKERLADATVLITNPFFINGLDEFLRNQQAELSTEIRNYFQKLQQHYEYNDILIVDNNGEIKLSLGDDSGPLHLDARQKLAQALKDHKPYLSDIHADASDDHAHISLIAPIIRKDGQFPMPVGAVILVCNVHDFLYPLIQSWPTPSETAETLLVRQDQENVLFLNELRHMSDSAMKLRIPMSREDLPAVMAIKGLEGIVKGRDYRGREVLAALRPIPGTSWYMVSKIDITEAFSTWRSFTVMFVILLFGLFLLTGAVVLFFWQREQKDRYRVLFQTESALRKSEKKYLTTLKSIGDAVITTDSKGCVDLLNPLAEQLTGCFLNDAKGKYIDTVFRLINESAPDENIDIVSRVLSEGRVIGMSDHVLLISRNGTKRPIAVSGAPVCDTKNENIGMVVVFRDMSVAKKTETRLRESEHMLNETGRMARIGGWEHDLLTGETTWTDVLYDIMELERELPPPGIKVHLSYYPNEYRKLLNHAYLKSIREGSPFDLELQVHTAANNLLWCRVYGEPVHSNGSCIKMRGTFQDITERKKMELAVRENQRRISTLMNNLPGIAYRCIYHPDWPMQYVSKGIYEITGYTEEEICIGGKIQYGELIHPDDRQQVRETVQDAIEYNVPFELDYRIYRKDGRIRYVWERGTAIPSANSGQTILEGFISDITVRKEAEKERDEAIYWLNLAISSSQVGLWDWNSKTGEIFLSRELKEQIGFSEDEFKDDFELLKSHIHPKDRKKLMISMQKYLRGELPKYTAEFRLRHKDGSYRWIYSQGEKIHDELNDSTRILGSHIDITELKQTESALLREKEKAQLYFNIAPFLIIGLDPNGDIFLLNDQGAAILECGKDEVIGTNWVDNFIPEEERDEMCKNFNLVMQGTMSSDDIAETTIVTASGARKRILWQNSVLQEKDGRITGTISSGLDITEKIDLRTQLMQAQKMESIGRLAGGVAHDFNNMLQIIIGHTDMALEEAQVGSSLHEDLQEVYRAAERATSLTRQLLAFARKQTVKPEILDLNKTVGSMLKMLQRLIGEDIDLLWKPAPNIWTVKIDPSQIDQILANLCVNARDAITGPGKLTIETGNMVFDREYCVQHHGFLPGKFILLAVSDDGCGMDKQTINNAFDPFFTTKPMGKGTGLGLATVYGIVKQNNGFINIYSEPGHGTTFKIYLPRFDATEDDKPAVRKTVRPTGGGETVLIVEDEPGVLELGTDMLKRLGYNVIPANHPDEALHIAGKNGESIDLLVTDIVMPNMNGKDLARQLKELCPHIRVLFMSGYTADVIAHRGVLEQNVCYMQKPFSSDDLAVKIREALQQNDN